MFTLKNALRVDVYLYSNNDQEFKKDRSQCYKGTDSNLIHINVDDQIELFSFSTELKVRALLVQE